MTTEIRTVGRILVKRYAILSTDFIVYDAWEPCGDMGRHSHSTVTTFEGFPGWYGRPRSLRDDAFFADLPIGPERSAVVKAWYAEKDAASYAAIIAAFPDAAEGTRDMGQIEVYVGE